MDLSVKVANLELENPFLVGPGQVTTGVGYVGKYLQRIKKAGWSGLVTKTIIQKDNPFSKLPATYIFPFSDARLRKIAMANIGPSASVLSIDKLDKDLRAARKIGLTMIPSVLCSTIDEWVFFARTMEQCNAPAVELNFSCPIVGKSKLAIGLSPSLVSEVVRAVKKECSIPIIVKLLPTPWVIASVAEAAEEAGANAITAVNTMTGLAGINIENGIPTSSDINNKATLVGLSGSIIKPIALGCVMLIAKSVKIPTFGVGGITDWRDAVEYLMVGASSVQICTTVMWRGFGIAKDLIKGLTGFMEKKGYETIQDIVGLSLKYFVEDLSEMDTIGLAKASIDKSRCTGCGLCATACMDVSSGAITLSDKIANVNKETCCSCGLCRIICPVPDCISLIKKGK